MKVYIEFTDGSHIEMRWTEHEYWDRRNRLADGEWVLLCAMGYTLTLYPKGIAFMFAVVYEAESDTEVLADAVDLNVNWLDYAVGKRTNA